MNNQAIFSNNNIKCVLLVFYEHFLWKKMFKYIMVNKLRCFDKKLILDEAFNRKLINNVRAVLINLMKVEFKNRISSDVFQFTHLIIHKNYYMNKRSLNLSCKFILKL